MAERKAWTPEEDRTLRLLFETRHIKRWAEIARLMETEFKLQGRSGKQCRQRYHNHLDQSIKRQKWTSHQEQELVRLHNYHGNRWAEISRAIPGRSENCVKNKFYSILRRGLRHINQAIKSKLKRYKELEIGVIYKIVEACEQNYRRNTLTKEMIEHMEIKKEIIGIGLSENRIQEERMADVKVLIEKIKNFSRKLQGKKVDREKDQENVEQQKAEGSEAQMEVSEDIESSQYRDNCPPQVYNLVPRKTSFLNFILQAPEPEAEEPTMQGKQLKQPRFYKNLSNISNQSNQSLEQFQNPNRPYDLHPEATFKSFDLSEFDNNKSPRPIIFVQSPYFDQLKGNFNSWTQFYPH